MPQVKVGVPGSEILTETPVNLRIENIREAESEAIPLASALRELVHLWSTLDTSAQQAVLAIVRSSAK